MPIHAVPRLCLRLSTLVLSIAALGLFAGCTVGPDFQRPTPPNGGYIAKGDSTTPRTATAPALEFGIPIANDWYHLLGSPALNALVHQALRNNPDLQAARASVDQARAELRATAGGELPQLKGRGLANRAHVNPGALGLPVAGGHADDNLFAGLLQLSYNLDVFGKLRRQIEAKQAVVEYQRDEALNTYIGLVNQVVTTAFDLATAQSLIDATQRLAQAQAKQLKITRLQEKVGTVARAQTLTAQAQLEGTQATLPALRQRRAAAASALAALVGKAPSQFKVPKLRLSDFAMPTAVPVSLPSQLVQQRPDILAAEQLLHQASAEIGVATAARLPSFSLSADYGSISDHGADFFNAGNALWVLGGNITTPLFDGGTLKAQQDAAKAAYLQADAQYRSTVLNAFSQVATALRALNNDAATLAARDRALHTAKQALELSQMQLSTGTVDELQLLVAQQEYRSELLSRVNAQAQGFTDIAALMHALGGGWWNAPRDPVPPMNPATLSGEHHG